MAIPEGVSFDELNKIYREEKGDNLRSMPFDEFFGEMDLSQEQKERRIETAKDIQEFTLIALASMYLTYLEGGYGYLDTSVYMSEAYRSMLERMGIPLTDYFSSVHAENVATEIALATMNHSEDPYFYSEDRAMLIAENEANSIWNDSEYEDAILTGKTHKTWVAMKDKKTRDTHREVDGMTVRIDEYFPVGSAMLLYPGMSCEYPEEVVNCRCTLIYS